MLKRDNQKWLVSQHCRDISTDIILNSGFQPRAFSYLTLQKKDPEKKTITICLRTFEPEHNEISAQLHDTLRTATNIPAWSPIVLNPSHQYWIDTEPMKKGSESLKNYLDIVLAFEDIDKEAYAHLLFFAGHPSALIDLKLQEISKLGFQLENEFDKAKDVAFKYAQFYNLETQIIFHLSLQYQLYKLSIARRAKNTSDPTHDIELDRHLKTTEITLNAKTYDLCETLVTVFRSRLSQQLFATLFYTKVLENQIDMNETFTFLQKSERNRLFFLTWRVVKKIVTALTLDYQNYELSINMLKLISQDNPNFNLARENLFGTYTLSLQNLEKNSEEYDNITDDLLDDALTAGDPHHIDAAIMLGLGDDILAEPKKFVSTDAKEKSILISATAFKSLLNRVRAAEKQPKSEAPDSMSTFKV